jgi:hypothetical protein
MKKFNITDSTEKTVASKEILTAVSKEILTESSGSRIKFTDDYALSSGFSAEEYCCDEELMELSHRLGQFRSGIIVGLLLSAVIIGSIATKDLVDANNTLIEKVGDVHGK